MAHDIIDTPLDIDEIAQGITHSYHTQTDALGVSKVATYLGCPRAYELQYIERVSAPSSPAAAMGSTFHAVVRAAHAQGWTLADADAAADLMTDLWAEVRPETSNPGDPEAAKALESARDEWLPWYLNWIGGQVNIGVEESFEFDLQEALGVDAVLKGTMDRVYRYNGQTIISDVKTGKRTPSDNDLATDLQASLYCWAYNELTGGTPADAFEVCQVRTRKHPRTTRSPEYLDAVMESIVVPVARGIQAGYFPCNPGTKYGCSYCDVQQHCTVGKGVS